MSTIDLGQAMRRSRPIGRQNTAAAFNRAAFAVKTICYHHGIAGERPVSPEATACTCPANGFKLVDCYRKRRNANGSYPPTPFQNDVRLSAISKTQRKDRVGSSAGEQARHGYWQLPGLIRLPSSIHGPFPCACPCDK